MSIPNNLLISFSKNVRELFFTFFLVFFSFLLFTCFTSGLNKISARDLSAPFDWYRYQGASDSGACSTTNCGPTSVAMAIEFANNDQYVSISDVRSYMTGTTCGDTNMSQIRSALSHWDVQYSNISGMNAVKSAVNDRGHIVIVPVKMSDISAGSDLDTGGTDASNRYNRYSSFTGYHVLVVKGISDDGNWVIVYDPNVFSGAKYWYSNGQAKGKDRYYNYNNFATAFANNGNSAIEITEVPSGGNDCDDVSTNGIAFYDSDACNGNKLEFTSTGFRNLTDQGWNDRATSVDIRSGWSARVWRDTNRGGSTACLDHSMWDLDQDKYSDNTTIGSSISSVHIYSNSTCTDDPPPVSEVQLCTSDDGNSGCWIFNSVGVYDLPASGHNDIFRSVKVPSGWSALLFREGDLRGTAECYSSDRKPLPTGDPWDLRGQVTFVQVFNQSNCPTSQLASVLMYDGQGYGGHYWGVGSRSGIHNINDIANNASTYFNDKAESIRIPAGKSVKLYEHANAEGAASSCYAGDVSNLNFNNTASSVHIYDNTNCSGPDHSIQLYKDIGYKGEYCYGDSAGNYNSFCSGYDNQVSSIWLKSGWSVRVFENTNLTGGQKCFNGSDANVTNDTLNNGVSVKQMSSFVLYNQANCPNPDTTKPTGKVTAPIRNSYQRATTITLKADASDTGSGVQFVEFYAWSSDDWSSNQMIYLGEDRSAPYELNWNVSSLPEATNAYIGIMIGDNAGNLSGMLTQDQYNTYFTIDRSKPTGKITAPTSNAIEVGPTIVIKANASDTGSGVSKVDFYAWSGDSWSNQQWIKLGTDTTSPYQYTWDVSNLQERTYAFISADITDKAGNTSGILWDPSWTNISIHQDAKQIDDHMTNLNKWEEDSTSGFTKTLDNESMKISTNLNNNSVKMLRSQYLVLETNQVYHIAAAVRTQNADPGEVLLEFFDSGFQWIGDARMLYSTGGTSASQEYRTTYLMPTTFSNKAIRYVKVVLRAGDISGSATSATTWFDDIYVNKNGRPFGNIVFNPAIAKEESTVSLDASGSKDPDGNTNLQYTWSQISGTNVTISNANQKIASFVAPNVNKDYKLTFQLIVSDGTTSSVPVTKTITIKGWIPTLNEAFNNQNLWTNSGASNFSMAIESGQLKISAINGAKTSNIISTPFISVANTNYTLSYRLKTTNASKFSLRVIGLDQNFKQVTTKLCTATGMNGTKPAKTFNCSLDVFKTNTSIKYAKVKIEFVSTGNTSATWVDFIKLIKASATTEPSVEIEGEGIKKDEVENTEPPISYPVSYVDEEPVSYTEK
jgi:hypothetical protein